MPEIQQPKTVVLSLMNSWAKGWASFVAGFERALADDCVYSNLGFPTWRGKAEIMKALDASREEFGLDRIRLEYITVLEGGEHVVVERREHWFDSNDKPLFPEPELAMGIFQVRHGKIVAYRDYFDPRTFLAMLERKKSTSPVFLTKE